MKKNVASQIVQCQVTTAADGTPFTGSVTVSVTGDGGTRATGSVGSGAATHEGGGLHSYAPSQAETNYDIVSFQFAGTGAITSAVHFTTSYPQTADVASGVVVNSISAGAITAAAIATDAIDADAIADNAINAAAIASGAITAAKFASGAIDAAALATDAVTEIQSGLATSSNVTTSTSTITALLPAALVGGRMDASVGAMAANVITAAATAADFTAEVTAALALSTQVDALEAAVIAIEADTQDIQSRLPALLVGGRIDASVGAMASAVITAASLASDAKTAIATAFGALAATPGGQTVKGILARTAYALWGKRAGQNGPTHTAYDDDGTGTTVAYTQTVNVDGSTAETATGLTGD